MVAIPYTFTTDNTLDFNSYCHQSPPSNIEAEADILGGIMLDPYALDRVKDVLEPHHFYVGSHRDIYQCCLRLNKKGKPTDVLHVTAWLSENGLLERIGGRNKIASLVHPIVSAINIDSLADLVIQHSLRRDFIKVGHEILRLGYATHIELDEAITEGLEKANAFASIPNAPTREERTKQAADLLRKELTRINTTIPQPSDRLYELKTLAKKYPGWSIKDFEQFYFKSLVGNCGRPMTYKQLQELAGSSVREWLQYGLIPVGSSILLSADGGIGKTKAAYNLAKSIIQGQPIGNFMASGEKRRILFIQGDEQPGDIFEALEILGYGDEDINKYVRIWTSWTFENMPALIQEIKEEQYDFIIMDSLSTANRFSIYEESQMEYARPILELNAIAVQYQVSFLIIHHMNRAGSTRGTTAIRNAVSESWILKKDDSSTATPYDRILEIDKSRSRSSGKKYKFYFDPQDLTFTYLGEQSQVTDEHYGLKDEILEFLAQNRNIKYTTDELAHRIGYSVNSVRKYAGDLSADGLITVERRPGKPNRYSLKFRNRLAQLAHSTGTENAQGDPLKAFSLYQTSNVGTEGNTAKADPCIKQRITSSVPNLNADTASDSSNADPKNAKNAKKISEEENYFCENLEILDQQSPNHSPGERLGLVQRNNADPGYMDQPDHPSATPSAPSEQVSNEPITANDVTENVVQPIVDSRPVCPKTGNILQPPIEIKERTPLGESITLVTAKQYVKSKGHIAVRFHIEWHLLGETKSKFMNFVGKPSELVNEVKEITHKWQDSLMLNTNNLYKVRFLGEDNYEWSGHCIMTDVPNPPIDTWYTFKCVETSEIFQVAGCQDFEFIGIRA